MVDGGRCCSPPTCTDEGGVDCTVSAAVDGIDEEEDGDGLVETLSGDRGRGDNDEDISTLGNHDEDASPSDNNNDESSNRPVEKETGPFLDRKIENPHNIINNNNNNLTASEDQGSTSLDDDDDINLHHHSVQNTSPPKTPPLTLTTPPLSTTTTRCTVSGERGERGGEGVSINLWFYLWKIEGGSGAVSSKRKQKEPVVFLYGPLEVL